MNSSKSSIASFSVLNMQGNKPTPCQHHRQFMQAPMPSSSGPAGVAATPHHEALRIMAGNGASTPCSLSHWRETAKTRGFGMPSLPKQRWVSANSFSNCPRSPGGVLRTSRFRPGRSSFARRRSCSMRSAGCESASSWSSPTSPPQLWRLVKPESGADTDFLTSSRTSMAGGSSLLEALLDGWGSGFSVGEASAEGSGDAGT